ncbi:hypothetical protein AB0M43_03680 [Longispora sp. NPDC051575]|uniref:hypothetical protein n=1 Tax=Longispora sp. NPDC051575 TaxID=3154943 RepID=UPI003432F8D6
MHSRFTALALLCGGLLSTVALAAPAHADPAEPVAASIPAKCVDGTRIRSSPPDGTVVGLCYAPHSVTAHCRPSTATGYWVRITDATTEVSGWVSGNLVKAVGWENLPYC